MPSPIIDGGYNGGLQIQGLKTSIYGLDTQFCNDWVTTIHHNL